jgi:hypothetical protein
MTKVTVTFDVPDEDAVTGAVIAVEDALGDNVANFEWDADE